jgi:hypothetical protein
MGSYPRVADSKATYDLYGPANRLLCTSYDRAMVIFLACVEASLWVVAKGFGGHPLFPAATLLQRLLA